MTTQYSSLTALNPNPTKKHEKWNMYKWPQQRTKAYASDVFLDCERLLTTVRLCAPTARRWGEKSTGKMKIKTKTKLFKR